MSLISPAYAQAGAPAGGGATEMLILIGVFFLIMYFVVIRPQNKRNKEHNELLSSLSKGDEVTTTGGILGKVTECGENFISIEIAAGTEIKIQRQSIASLMPKGTMQAKDH